MKKVVYVVLGLIVCAFLIVYNLVLFTVPKNLMKMEDFDLSDTTKYHAPFTDLDMEDCTAYLYIHKDDQSEAPACLKKSLCWKTSDAEVLKDLKRLFVFKNRGGELCTCDSRFILKRGHVVIYESEIVVTNDYVGVQGFHSPWSESPNKDDLISLFSRFEPSREIVVIE